MLKDREVTERRIPAQRRKGRKRFAIESKWTSEWYPDRGWSITRRYHTEKSRDDALRTLQRKAYPRVEYRAA